ncbi:MAG: helix-turn-helix domain-containing protein [Hyphomicrobiales bacterium]|nr:helix-turn-helix domain-containing protein [Hyphomicrobiales bacterium]
MQTPQRRNTAEAADYLGLARRTLEKYRIHGGGPAFYKLGRRVVYDTDDLDAWLQTRRRRSTADIGAAA